MRALSVGISRAASVSPPAGNPAGSAVTPCLACGAVQASHAQLAPVVPPRCLCVLQGLVYALDIAQLMGDKMPVCKAGDFEQWTVPADDHTPRCLLGTDLSMGLFMSFALLSCNARREKGKTTMLQWAARQAARAGVRASAHLRAT